MPRNSRLPDPPPSWKPTHQLRWVARDGVVVEWSVRLDMTEVAGREIATALSLEEAEAKLPAAWVRTDGVWTHNGRPGFLGREGAVQLVPIKRR